MARKTPTLIITAETFDEVLAKNYGPKKSQVIPGRAVHWPDSSEIRASAGAVLWARDPWLKGQGHKLVPYTGDLVPETPKKILTRQRLQELERVLCDEQKADARVEKPRTGTRAKKTTAKKTAGRAALESAAEEGGADELVGLDG